MTAHATETVEVTRADMDRVVVVEPDGELRLADTPGVVLLGGEKVVVYRLRPPPEPGGGRRTTRRRVVNNRAEKTLPNYVTVYDFYAASALTGLLAYSGAKETHALGDADRVTEEAFDYAEAMLAERARRLGAGRDT